MSLKHLLVHVDSSDRAAVRLHLATRLARRFGARLTGLFAESGHLGRGVVSMRSPQNMEKARQEARARFEEIGRRAELETEWWQVEHGEDADVTGWTVVCCRYVDLAIFGQVDPEHHSALPHHLIEQVLEHSGRPILVVPYVGNYDELGRRVLIAWTGSRESARALNDAIPLIQNAQEVTVIALQHAPAATGAVPVPPLDIAAHLRAHGIDAQYERILVEELGAVDNVLNRAAEAAADLTVLGGYGHFGFPLLQRHSTTRDILRTMTTPVFLSH